MNTKKENKVCDDEASSKCLQYFHYLHVEFKMIRLHLVHTGRGDAAKWSSSDGSVGCSPVVHTRCRTALRWSTSVSAQLLFTPMQIAPPTSHTPQIAHAGLQTRSMNERYNNSFPWCLGVQCEPDLTVAKRKQEVNQALLDPH